MSETEPVTGRQIVNGLIGGVAEFLRVAVYLIKYTIYMFGFPVGSTIVLTPILMPVFAGNLGTEIASFEPYFTAYSYTIVFIMMFYLQHGGE